MPDDVLRPDESSALLGRTVWDDDRTDPVGEIETVLTGSGDASPIWVVVSAGDEQLMIPTDAVAEESGALWVPLPLATIEAAPLPTDPNSIGTVEQIRLTEYFDSVLPGGAAAVDSADPWRPDVPREQVEDPFSDDDSG